MTDVHNQLTMLCNLALADAAFPVEYAKLKTAHPGIRGFLVHNPELVARWWSTSLHGQIRDIGWGLYAKGGVDAMITATDVMRGWAQHSQHLTEFMELIDTVWDGIGFRNDPRGVYESTAKP